MFACTFFGHKTAPDELYQVIYEEIERLITDCSVTKFFVGNNGNFDRMAAKALFELKKEYPDIDFAVMLAYLPKANEKEMANSIYPEGMESVPQRFAISYRNKWMLQQSDFVVSFVKHNLGGAVQFKKLAERQGKTIIELSAK